MPFEKINNLQIYYEVHGEGEVVIFLHHGFGCTRIWENVYPEFVKKGFKVVMYDRRGYGRSERGHDFQEFYESDQYRQKSVEELKVIKDLLNIKECHLVGQCEGGVIGIDYSIKYPQEIKTLTVASTQCYSDVPMTELNIEKFGKRFKDLEIEIQAKMIKWHGESAEINYNQFAKYGGAYGVDYFDLRPILSDVACHVLILYPDRSSIFNVEQAVVFYRHLGRGELAVFPKCGHNTYEQRPEDYVSTVLNFIKRNTQGEDSKVYTVMTCLA